MTDQTARVKEEARQTSAGASEQAQAPEPSTAFEREHAEMKDRLLRALAEMENLRKRTEREIADSRLYSVTSFARDLLVVADNMRRALETVPPELRNTAESGVKALIDGVELTERELLKALEKNGVRQFTPQGEKFDPNVHQAMFEIPDATVPAGSVVQVVQPGYMIGDRVLRPALVGVSKGGPKAAPVVSSNDNDNSP
ncbi:MAG TPA: nucleotide exchange factor GrpE [Xanthobacteraceae bacterium]|jgi:molecular chaperone GrpE|nr:nucleotide exchange factor GrpE [Xanthobacteraceae bacterium]HYQ07261.1 nucleotide exchange factor GrpE [Xanthobacteraceae bacterium]